MINWNYFKNRPNVQNLTETAKRRRFLLEKEELEFARKAAAAIFMGTGGAMTQNTEAAEDDMIVIAKLLNLNLKTVATNVIPFVNGFTAANTVPERLVIIPKGGVYDGTGIPETLATTTVVFDGTFQNGSDRSFVVAQTVFAGPGTIFVDGQTAEGTITQLFANPIAGIVDQDSGSDLTYNENVAGAHVGSRVVYDTFGSEAVNLQLVGYTNFDDFLDALIVFFLTYSYGVVDNRPGENSITLTAPAGSGDTFNGAQVRIKDENDTTYLTTPLSVAFSGGVTAQPTAFSLQLDGLAASYNPSFSLPSLIYQTNLLSANMGDVFLSTGDWSFPVTVGTIDDFFVDVYIMGKSL